MRKLFISHEGSLDRAFRTPLPLILDLAGGLPVPIHLWLPFLTVCWAEPHTWPTPDLKGSQEIS